MSSTVGAVLTTSSLTSAARVAPTSLPACQKKMCCGYGGLSHQPPRNQPPQRYLTGEHASCNQTVPNIPTFHTFHFAQGGFGSNSGFNQTIAVPYHMQSSLWLTNSPPTFRCAQLTPSWMREAAKRETDETLVRVQGKGFPHSAAYAAHSRANSFPICPSSCSSHTRFSSCDQW